MFRFSGGKDSCFNMMCCIAEGHQLVALANLRPKPQDKGYTYHLFIYPTFQIFQTISIMLSMCQVL